MATVGFHLLMLVFFGLLPAAPQALRTGLVEGSVIDGATGQPLKDATVTLSFVGPRPEREMKTDEKGLFAFIDVEPGQYELKVEQPGYLTQKYGQIAYDSRIGRNLVVQAGGRYNVPFPMVRTAIVSGRIYDTNRQPVAKAELQLLTIRYDSTGQRALYRLTTALPVNTDDRGEYRFEGVPPGDYYVKAAYRSLPANQVGVSVQANNVAATYYPGVTSPDEPRTNLQIYSARIAIDVVDRDVTDLTVVIDSGIDIKGETKLAADANATTRPNFSDVQPLFVVTDGMPSILSPTAFLARQRFVQQDGTFEIPHVPFGRYRLLVSLPGPMRAYYASAARIGTEDILGQVFEINSDTTGPLVIELSDAGATMAGVVTDRGGVPV